MDVPQAYPLDRRQLLAGSAGLAVALAPLARASAQAPVPPSTGGPVAAQANALYDRFVQEDLRRYPEEATSLGFDKGDLAWTKAALSDSSLEAWEVGKAITADRLRRLKGLDRRALSGLDGVNYDVVEFNLAIQDEGNRFPFAGGPYVLSQLQGSYQSTPDFLDTQHSIATREDADAYLSRLSAFQRVMDQELELARHDVGLGVVPPDFIIDKALVQMTALRDTPPDKSNLVQSVARRAREKGIPGDYAGEATRIYETAIQPALTRQIEYLKSLRPSASPEAGITRIKQGPEYYAWSLRNYTTANISPEEVHKTGLDLVAGHNAQIDAILKSQGMSQGTVGQRLRALYNDPKYRYPNTDEGKVKLIADLNEKVRQVTARLPQWFGTLPKAPLEIRRVPKAIEAGAPGGYYNSPPVDGSRPGIYWINLRDTAEVPSWTLPTLTFHEGIPGHHLQGSLSNQAPLPLIRKMVWFSGYGEGWALYAEQLAVEMGMYEHDPMGHVGQLHDSLFRAVRLVVDSGLHAMHWSREQAVKYYVDTLGDQDPSAVTEVERYCVWPGQACSYMVGKLDWLKQRDRARKALGRRFDIRTFHDAGLLSGAMPLAVLDGAIDDYIRRSNAA